MAKITYLLGAGASANALPVIKGFGNAINNIIDDLNGHLKPEYTEVNKTHNVTLKNIIDDFKWFREMNGRHSTIDTYAKKLSIIRDNETLSKLKHLLSITIAYMQAKSSVDLRYDTFFASILNQADYYSNIPKPPDNIKIVSWNYDNQIELAFSEYLQPPGNSNFYARETLSFTSRHNYTGYKQNQYFEVIKLNGQCSNLQYSSALEEAPIEEPLFDNVKNEATEHLINQYHHYISKKDKKYSGINFAWEDGVFDEYGKPKSFREYVSDKLSATETLVIIGYSFPFFNRKIDGHILSKIPNNQLQKIYIQDVYPDSVATKLLATSTHFSREKIELIKVDPNNPYDQFYIPHEL